jgi:hypothetical protein
MKQLVRYLINNTLRHLGFRLVGIQHDRFMGVDPAIPQIYDRARMLTQTSRANIYCLCEALQYASKQKVPGDFVECGVFRGGSAMAAALMMLHLNDLRPMHLYDTFCGMPEPSEKDVYFDGTSAFEKQALGPGGNKADEAEVSANIASAGYDMSRVFLHKGLVERTLPAEAPDQIAILRLDTDWYESTKHELEHLWPRLSPGGVLIIDDYGFCAGAREAVDDFFAGNPVLLYRIDYTARMAIKR